MDKFYGFLIIILINFNKKLVIYIAQCISPKNINYILALNKNHRIFVIHFYHSSKIFFKRINK